MSFLLQNPLFSPLRVFAQKILTRTLASRILSHCFRRQRARTPEFYTLPAKTRAKVNLVLRDGEPWSIYAGVLETGKIPGSIAEVGVFKGGSSTISSVKFCWTCPYCELPR